MEDEALRSQWRDMESAPKDGTKILVFTYHGDVEITEWYQSFWTEYIEEPDGRFKKITKLSHEGWNGNFPLLWQPLPQGPDDERFEKLQAEVLAERTRPVKSCGDDD